jgi:hypothetical protein
VGFEPTRKLTSPRLAVFKTGSVQIEAAPDQGDQGLAVLTPLSHPADIPGCGPSGAGVWPSDGSTRGRSCGCLLDIGARSSSAGKVSGDVNMSRMGVVTRLPVPGGFLGRY